MKDIPTPQRVIEIKRKRRLHRLRLMILFFILFLSIVGALAYFSSNERIVINKIVVTGTSVINPPEVISQVEKQLAGKYLHLYNRANSFIYPHQKIYDNLLATFPRIKELSIVRENLNVLKINISERLGSYLYCGSLVPELSSEVGENCYFVNNDGYIFDKAPYFSGSVYFKYYVKIKDETNPLGQNVFEVNRFHEIVRFIDGVTALGFRPISLVVGEDGTYSLFLNHDSGETAPVIIFKDDNNLENILSNLSTAMNKSEFANEINSKYSTLQYIDLRFKSKVLYKFK
jgi:hypothetical protein